MLSGILIVLYTCAHSCGWTQKANWVGSLLNLVLLYCFVKRNPGIAEIIANNASGASLLAFLV